MERIDAHQHFWNYSRETHGWITDDMPVLKRNFLPADLAEEFTKNRIAGCIAVQAEQTLKETMWLLDLAHENPWIRGVVGWVDLTNPEVGDTLEGLTEDRLLRGVRHIAQSEPDDRFLLDSAFQNGISQLRRFNLAYDILIYPRQLPAAIELATLHASQPFVLDHLAKPAIRDAAREPWTQQIRELARRPNVYCKVSGMVTEAAWNRWHEADFHYYLETVLHAFGPDRLIYGSDWPVCLLAASYAQVLHICESYFSSLTPSENARIFHDNARRLYGC